MRRLEHGTELGQSEHLCLVTVSDAQWRYACLLNPHHSSKVLKPKEGDEADFIEAEHSAREPWAKT